jgi:hypothetical protein
VDEDNDETEDALSPEFRVLLATVTREEVDKFPTRCPHPETSDRMTKVCLDSPNFFLSSRLTGVYLDRLAYNPRQRRPRLDRRHGYLCNP